METKFRTPVFIEELQADKIDISATPFFYNGPERPCYLEELPASLKPLAPVAQDPALAVGREYEVATILGVKTDAGYGVETQLGFAAAEVVFEPLWATREVAAAFGITLVEKGQAIEVSSPVNELHHVEYEYGVFAGHWSPYQDTGNQLLSVVCTDLEHHDFPHIFVSTDPAQPLVVSVGRYWPRLGKIRLADLWLPRGSALYIPPQPDVANAECMDLHNNRNSARACWGNIRQNSIVTQTLLRTTGGFFHWYWNAIPTTHSAPLEIR